VAHPFTTLCDALNQVSPWSLKRIYSTYRGRFGIESSYRQSRQARIFTTSRKPWFRFLIFGLSLILRNLWLEVRWLLGEPKRGRGGRKIAKELLPFPMFLRWLVSAAWKALCFRTWLYPQTELPNPLWRFRELLRLSRLCLPMSKSTGACVAFQATVWRVPAWSLSWRFCFTISSLYIDS
jgi:hypothetical protein